MIFSDSAPPSLTSPGNNKSAASTGESFLNLPPILRSISSQQVRWLVRFPTAIPQGSIHGGNRATFPVAMDLNNCSRKPKSCANFGWLRPAACIGWWRRRGLNSVIDRESTTGPTNERVNRPVNYLRQERWQCPSKPPRCAFRLKFHTPETHRRKHLQSRSVLGPLVRFNTRSSDEQAGWSATSIPANPPRRRKTLASRGRMWSFLTCHRISDSKSRSTATPSRWSNCNHCCVN